MQFAYRFNTVVIVFAVLSYNLTDYLLYSIMVGRMGNLGGWSIGELVVMGATANLFWMLVKVLYENNFENTIKNINSGDFDFYLLKPTSAQFMSFFFPPDFIKLSFFPITIFLYVLAWKLDPSIYQHISLLIILFALFCFVVSLALNYSLSLIVLSISFYSGRVEELLSFIDKTQDFMKYPLEIFHGFFRIFLGVILPVGLFAGLPAKILLGKVDSMRTVTLQYLGLLLVFITISQVMWRNGLRYYSSASS